jgi:PD-(D/E)XK nuclease superfamily
VLMAVDGDPKVTEVKVTGAIDGIPMTGHIDRLMRYDGKLVICDWKHTNDFARKYLKDAAKPEHIAQTSLYAELYAQQHSERPTRGVNWYHFTSSPPFAPMWYDLWPLDKVLEHKPYECEFTVRQILHQAADFAGGRMKWQDLPLVGKGFQFSGKSACDYCAVFDICQTQAMGAPF